MRKIVAVLVAFTLGLSGAYLATTLGGTVKPADDPVVQPQGSRVVEAANPGTDSPISRLAIEQARLPASTPPKYVPSKEQRLMDRRLQKFTSVFRLEMPSRVGLSEKQWQLISELYAQSAPDLQKSEDQRQRVMRDIAKSRIDAGQIELVHQGADLRELPRAERIEILKKEKPEFREQQVTLCLSDNGRFVCRINPGENAQLDALTEEMRLQAAVLVAGVRQIVESDK